MLMLEKRKVEWKEEGVLCEKEFDDLAQAMAWAKQLNLFVTITGGECDIVGIFGVDSIKDGKCPDGIDYTWVKRRRAK